jgi:hypothetical protein
MTIPTDLVTVLYDYWFLYYVGDGELKWIQGPKKDEKESTTHPPEYKRETLKFEGLNIGKPRKGNTKLAVVEYKDNNNNTQVNFF